MFLTRPFWYPCMYAIEFGAKYWQVYDANFYVCFLVYSCNFEFKKKNWQVLLQFLNATCMCFLVLKLYAILNLRKQNWQIWCQFLNACCLHMRFFALVQFLNCLKGKLTNMMPIFGMLFSCAFYVLVQFWIY